MLSEIWRYPVKSCGGEMLEKVAVGANGLNGDRSWAMVDSETGLVASVKRPAVWASLLSLTCSVEGEHARFVIPGGETYTTENLALIEKELSTFVGRSIVLKRSAEINSPTLERTDPDVDALLNDGTLVVGEATTGALGAASASGTVFDFAPIHVITTPTLSALEDAGEPTAGDRRRFRPNFVLDIDGPAFQENHWPGCQLVVGAELVLDVIIQSPRCVVPALAQIDIPKSPSTLRGVATLNRIELDGHGVFPCAGVYASTTHGGFAALGASVSLDTDPG